MPLLPISGGLIISGSFIVSGSTDFASGPISGSLIPYVSASTTSSFSLGSPNAAWKDLYVSNGTIYFLNGTGQQQGTLSTTADGLQLGSSQITGSLFITPTHKYNLYFSGTSSYFVAEVAGKPSTAFSIFNNPTSVNGVLFTIQNTNGIYSVLPFDKKYTSYFVMNNGVEGVHNTYSSSLVLSLPPWVNTRMAPGETVSVYNMSSGSNLLDSGKIYVVSLVQQATATTSTSGAPYNITINSTVNNGALLSGSWAPSGSGYTNVNPAINAWTSQSIALNPGEKGIFEMIIYPAQVDISTPSYQGQRYPTTGSLDGTYLTNSVDYLMGYRFVGIETI